MEDTIFIMLKTFIYAMKTAMKGQDFVFVINIDSITGFNDVIVKL